MPKRKLFYIKRDSEEILNIIESFDGTKHFIEEIDNADELQMVLLPPIDRDNSDKDDASSDCDETSATVRDIGKGILAEKSEIRACSKAGIEVLDVDKEVTQSSAKKQCSRAKKCSRKWHNKPLKQSYEKYNCDFSETESSIVTKFKDQNFKPIDVFKYCFSENIINSICKETVKYAVQGGDFQFTLSGDDLYKYFGILLLSGYNKLPQRRMYWEARTDSNNFLVHHAMNGNKFEKIHKYLHFNDNSKLDACDKLYKIRPLLDHVNDKFCQYAEPMGNRFSLDEAMEPYFGHHGMKQFIRGQFIRYGFKFWCLTRSDGFLVKFYPYTGVGDKIAGKTLGSSVTEKVYSLYQWGHAFIWTIILPLYL